MLRIVPYTVPRVGRSDEHFPDGFELHLLRRRMKAAGACSFRAAREREGEGGREGERMSARFQNGRRVHPISFENGVRMYVHPVPKGCGMFAAEQRCHI